MLMMSASGGIRTVDVRITPGPAGTTTVAMKSEALPGTLATFAGTLTVAGLDIVSAVILISPDGMVTDSFDVVRRDGGPLETEDAEKIAKYAAGVLRGGIDLSKDLDAVRRERVPNPGVECSVEVNSDSELTTGIRISCADRPGLLFDITSTLTHHGARVRALSVLTFNDRAVDTFRVVNRLERPFEQQAAIRMIGNDLRRVCSA